MTLVGVVAPDQTLNFPDFRAAERTFQLVTQLAGRSGRDAPGLVIVQTFQPSNPAGGISIARLVLPHALGNAPAM